MKTSEITGAALDWAVAKCENVECDEDNEPIWFEHDGLHAPRCPYKPSTNWAQGGPIIEREGMTLSCRLINSYAMMNVGYLVTQYGDTPLIAAMRCYVASKLGDEVEIPKELS